MHTCGHNHEVVFCNALCAYTLIYGGRYIRGIYTTISFVYYVSAARIVPTYTALVCRMKRCHCSFNTTHSQYEVH